MKLIKNTHLMKHLRHLAIFMCLATLLPSTAHADCTDPNGKEGEMRYNSDYKAFQGCAGSTWMAFNEPEQGCSPSGLVGRWKFNETSGTTIYDSSGNGYHGTYASGTVTPATGPNGDPAVELAADDIIRVTDNGLDNLPEFSVCGWLYKIDTPDGWSVPIGKLSGNNGWDVYTWGGNGIAHSHWGVGEKSVSGFPSNTWTHFCVTWNGAVSDPSSIRMYPNGTEVVAAGGAWGSSLSDDSSYDLTFGANHVGNYRFAGRYSDIRIFNRELSSTEVADLYACVNN